MVTVGSAIQPGRVLVGGYNLSVGLTAATSLCTREAIRCGGMGTDSHGGFAASE